MTGVPAFNQRVYQVARSHPARRNPHLWRGRASALRASGAVHSVAQAIARNPFMIIVPCHRVLEAGRYADKISPNGGAISKRRLLSLEGTRTTIKQDAVRRAAPGCPAAPAYLNLPDEEQRRFCSAVISPFPSSAAPRRPATGRSPSSIACHSISYVRKGSFGCHCRGRFSRAGGGIDPGRPSRRRIHLHP